MVEIGGGIPGVPIVKQTAEAVEGLVKAVPVYQDLMQPTVREVGLVTARTVHAALAPLRGMVWGVEKIEEFLYEALNKRLTGTPPERIQTPEPTVAGPALEALRFAGNEETLREMYANLLATAMDRETAERAHPAFVDVIRQLAPDEAKIFTLVSRTRAVPRPLITVYAARKDKKPGSYVVRLHFSLLGEQAGCQHPHLTSNYVENLCRLGLIEIPPGRSYTDDNLYEPLENHADVLAVKTKIEAKGEEPEIGRESLLITNFGVQFYRACVAKRTSG